MNGYSDPLSNISRSNQSLSTDAQRILTLLQNSFAIHIFNCLCLSNHGVDVTPFPQTLNDPRTIRLQLEMFKGEVKPF